MTKIQLLSYLGKELYLVTMKIHGLRALPYLSKRKEGALKRLVKKRREIANATGYWLRNEPVAID
jgi:hypothetical protein